MLTGLINMQVCKASGSMAASRVVGVDIKSFHIHIMFVFNLQWNILTSAGST